MGKCPFRFLRRQLNSGSTSRSLTLHRRRDRPEIARRTEETRAGDSSEHHSHGLASERDAHR